MKQIEEEKKTQKNKTKQNKTKRNKKTHSQHAFMVFHDLQDLNEGGKVRHAGGGAVIVREGRERGVIFRAAKNNKETKPKKGGSLSHLLHNKGTRELYIPS